MISMIYSLLLSAALTAAPVIGQDSTTAHDDILGQLVADALAYHQNPSQSLRDAFNDKYLTVNEGSSPVDRYHIFFPDSTYYLDNNQTAAVLALSFGLVPEKYRDPVERNFLSSVALNNRHNIDVEPAAEPYFLETLARMGHNDLCYFLTDPDLNLSSSRKLPAEYVRNWRERYLAGVREGQWRGRSVLTVHPDFGVQELNGFDAGVQTQWGVARSTWVKNLMHARWKVTAPDGAKAYVYVPSVHRRHITKDGRARRVGRAEGCTVYRLKAGRSVSFEVDFDMPEYVVEQQFVYQKADFPQCHSSSICEAENGDLVTTFYGGSREGGEDVRIMVSRKPKGAEGWTAPRPVCDEYRPGFTMENPDLFRIPEPGEPIMLFYKVGPGYRPKEGVIELCRQAFWEGCVMYSYDNGETWTEPDSLQHGFLGPIKNPPVWHDGRIIAPSSTQHKYHHVGWRIHFEYSDDRGKTWQKSAPEDVELSIPTHLRKWGRVGENKDVPKKEFWYNPMHPIDAIQPTILIHGDGSLQALSRTQNGTASVTWSHDNGTTWGRETLTDIPNNRSGICACTLPDGRFAMVYTDFEPLPGGDGGAPRTPLKLAVSTDGLHWDNIVTLEDSVVKGYSYPCIICGSDGTLHITYTWRRFCIKYVKVKI